MQEELFAPYVSLLNNNNINAIVIQILVLFNISYFYSKRIVIFLQWMGSCLNFQESNSLVLYILYKGEQRLYLSLSKTVMYLCIIRHVEHSCHVHGLICNGTYRDRSRLRRLRGDDITPGQSWKRRHGAVRNNNAFLNGACCERNFASILYVI